MKSPKPEDVYCFMMHRQKPGGVNKQKEQTNVSL